MTSKEDIKFEIDQLRKDKMIFALDSIAASLAVLMLAIFVGTLFPTTIMAYIVGVMFVLVFGFWIFTFYGNTKRYFRIKRLEEKLK